MRDNSTYSNKDLTFLTCVDKEYINFLLPFCVFINNSNPGSKIEIFVHNKEIISNLTLPSNVTLNLMPEGNADTLRYIVSPTKFTKFTYITDVDILYTEPLIYFHLNIMKIYNINFSNVVRKNKKNRMSGLHFVETSSWYNDTKNARKSANVYGQDESELYKITNLTYPNITIPSGLWARPIHGIHASLGRKNIHDPELGWELNSQRVDFFKKVIEENPYFSDWFDQKVTQKIMKKP